LHSNVTRSGGLTRSFVEHERWENSSSLELRGMKALRSPYEKEISLHYESLKKESVCHIVLPSSSSKRGVLFFFTKRDCEGLVVSLMTRSPKEGFNLVRIPGGFLEGFQESALKSLLRFNRKKVFFQGQRGF